jgi:uncharacterized membrane protein
MPVYTGPAERTEMAKARSGLLNLGIAAYAAGSIATGLFNFIWSDFEAGHQPIQALGDHIPGRMILAYLAAAWLILGGILILRPRTVRQGGIALGSIYLIFGLFWLPRFITVPRILGYHVSVFVGLGVGVGQQFILAAAALLAVSLVSARRSKLFRMSSLIARWTFGLSSILFGLAHFTAIHEVAGMIPKWIPLGGNFWAITTGVAFLLSGIATLARLWDVLANRLLALMLLVFSCVVLLPGAFAHIHNHVAWGSNAYNLAAMGAAYLFAEFLVAEKSSSRL